MMEPSGKITEVDESASNNQTSNESVPSGFSIGFEFLKKTALGWKDERLKTFRPISSFLDRSKLSLPGSDALNRMKTNLSYFQTNYILVFLVFSLYCLISQPSLIFWIAAIFGLWYYVLKWRTEPIKVKDYEVPKKVVVGILAIISILVFYFVSVGNVIIWLIGISTIFVLLHSLFYTPPEIDEFGFGTAPVIPEEGQSSE